MKRLRNRNWHVYEECEESPKGRRKWKEADVADADGAALAIRTYLEQTELRRYLKHISDGRPLQAVCDIGAGYGRMCPILREFSSQVVAFEREPELLNKGRALNPTVEFRQAEKLQRLPARTGEFDFALTFTVLQHLTDAAAKGTMAEIKRVVRTSGHALICEENEHAAGDMSDPHGGFTIGRSVDLYKEWMAPLMLIEVSPRIVEPTYTRSNVGSYMLFKA